MPIRAANWVGLRPSFSRTALASGFALINPAMQGGAACRLLCVAQDGATHLEAGGELLEVFIFDAFHGEGRTMVWGRQPLGRDRPSAGPENVVRMRDDGGTGRLCSGGFIRYSFAIHSLDRPEVGPCRGGFRTARHRSMDHRWRHSTPRRDPPENLRGSVTGGK